MNEKLIEAVKTIKGVCQQRQYEEDCCKGCPLGRLNGDCIITNEYPEDWVINDKNKILI